MTFVVDALGVEPGEGFLVIFATLHTLVGVRRSRFFVGEGRVERKFQYA
jgi:hypothetical protein